MVFCIVVATTKNSHAQPIYQFQKCQHKAAHDIFYSIHTTKLEAILEALYGKFLDIVSNIAL